MLNSEKREYRNENWLCRATRPISTYPSPCTPAIGCLQIILALRSEHIHHLTAFEHFKRMWRATRYGIAVACMEQHVDGYVAMARHRSWRVAFDISSTATATSSPVSVSLSQAALPRAERTMTVRRLSALSAISFTNLGHFRSSVAREVWMNTEIAQKTEQFLKAFDLRRYAVR